MIKNTTTTNNKTNRVIKTFNICVLSMAVALVATGCNKTIKAKVNEPTKLVKLEQSIDVVSPVLSTSVSEKSKFSEVNRLEVGFDGNQVVAASGSGTVASYNLSGQSLWAVDLDEDIVGGVSFDAQSQTAIVTTKSANVVAIDTSNGNIRWQNRLEGTVLAPALVANNRVVLSGNDGIMHGLAIQTGESIWQFSTQTPGISVRGTAKPVLLDANTALVASADGRLHAIDIVSGVPKWSRRVGVPSGASEIQRMTDVDGSPVIDNNQLFAVSYSGQLIGVDLNSRQILFVEEAASKNSLAVIGNAVITTTLDGMVKAFNRQTGQLLWESKDLAYRKLSNPVTVGRYIAIGDLDGVVHFLSPQDGKIVSRISTKGAVNNLTVHSGYLLTQTTSGQVNVWRVIR